MDVWKMNEIYGTLLSYSTLQYILFGILCMKPVAFKAYHRFLWLVVITTIHMSLVSLWRTADLLRRDFTEGVVVLWPLSNQRFQLIWDHSDLLGISHDLGSKLIIDLLIGLKVCQPNRLPSTTHR